MGDGTSGARRLAVLTSGRQDWGILRSTCAALESDPAFELLLLVGGLHCSPRHGETARLIEAEGFRATRVLDWTVDADAATQMAEATEMVGRALVELRPDALVLMGDRFETAAAALAATVERVPIVHLHGGEETLGAFDNALRHAISKLAHLHLVSHERHAARLRRLGEAPDSIHVVGAPGLDNLHRSDLPGRAELEADLGALERPLVVVTLHPATLGDDATLEVRAVISAMDAVEATYVVTLPNSDPGNEVIRDAVTAVAARPRRVVVEALGERRYWGLLGIADAMLGNSSSALIEAPALALPAVNVGRRQEGRERGANVIDAPPTADAVVAALERALSAEFRASLAGVPCPFGDGHSAVAILKTLRDWRPSTPPTKPSIHV